MADLPEDIIFFNILSRLSVKTLIGLRLVCKAWHALTLNPNFIETQLTHHQNSPITYLVSGYRLRIISLHTEQGTTNSYFKLPKICKGMCMVYSIKGLVCLVNRDSPHNKFALWNPATKLLKFIKPPDPSIDHHNLKKSIDFPTRGDTDHKDTYYLDSMGMGFDTVANDFKLICVVRVNEWTKEQLTLFQIYSCNTDSWKVVASSDVFPQTTSEIMPSAVTVKDVPYWYCDNRCHHNHSIVSVDVHNDVLKHFPFPEEYTGEFFYEPRILEWMGSLAVMVYYDRNSHYELRYSLYVFNQSHTTWTKMYIVLPEDQEAHGRVLGYNNGDIIVTKDNKMYLFIPQTNKLRYLARGKEIVESSIAKYNESLVYVKGMEQLQEEDRTDSCKKKKKKKRKL